MISQRKRVATGWICVYAHQPWRADAFPIAFGGLYDPGEARTLAKRAGAVKQPAALIPFEQP